MNNTLLLVDNSYNAFYRINATLMWYKRAHPEEKYDKEYDWSTNKIYTDKLKKMYLNSLSKIIKKHKIELNNIYFCRDCKRKDIWRMDLYPEYKKNRDGISNNFGNIFKYIYSNILPELQEKGVRIISSDRAEADDVIAIIKNLVRDQEKDRDIVIITSDHDYLQLIDDKTYIYNLKNKLLNEKSYGSAKKDLMVKILTGDKSDNIPSTWKKCGEKTALKYLDNRELLQKKLKDPEILKRFELNQQLIDFKNIPSEIVDSVQQKFSNLL
jgi:5'-3' exonuclease